MPNAIGSTIRSVFGALACGCGLYLVAASGLLAPREVSDLNPPWIPIVSLIAVAVGVTLTVASYFLFRGSGGKKVVLFFLCGYAFGLVKGFILFLDGKQESEEWMRHYIWKEASWWTGIGVCGVLALGFIWDRFKSPKKVDVQ